MWLMVRSPWGRVLRSIREDEAAASAVGKNVFVYKLQVLILGALLGGIGSAFGALTAGLSLGLAMELSTWEGFLGGVEPKYKPVLAFLVLILLLLYRPQGLFGRARVL
jgi:ABC-type branched-subunit amino acid transport system permease subunit